MPRRKRIHYLNALYHVVLRGNHRQNIFFVDQDRFKFYDLLSEACEMFGCRVHLFCLMTNHVHLVIEIGCIPLAKIMQSIISQYARYINKQQQRKGHLCEGRYQAIVIQSERYLLELCCYIHTNPIKAKLVNNLNDYRWSSHLTYCDYEKISWVATELIFSLLKKHNQDYFNFMQERAQQTQESDCEKIENEYELIIDKVINLRLQPFAAENNIPINLSLEIIVTTICEQLQLTQEQLVSSSLQRKIVFARAMVTYFAHYRAGYRLIDIAIFLDKRADSISKATHAVLKKTHANLKIVEIIKMLERKLILQIK